MKVIQTLNGHVLIKPRAAEAVAGIEIPDSVDKEKPTIGEVMLTTDFPAQPGGCTQHTTAVRTLLSAGAMVIFNAFSPRKVQHDGEDCLIVNAEDIYAVIEA